MEMNSDFRWLYKKVRPIVLKLRQLYFIRIWELDDWDQEGMISLYLLLDQHPELVYDTQRLCIYFKTKFSNRVKDEIRKQESLKRSFDRMSYDEISEVSHLVADHCLDVSEMVAYREILVVLYQELDFEERGRLEYLMSGECFRGKRAFQRKVRTKLGNLGWGMDYSWVRNM